jgi:hypothetical protein
MDFSNKRNSTRGRTWQDTEATLTVIDSSDFGTRKTISINGIVDNIGSNGMFLKTTDFIPIPSKADIIINFDPNSNSKDYSIIASGETIRVTKKGVGIKFSSIDISKLQRCIINKMNNHINN